MYGHTDSSFEDLLSIRYLGLRGQARKALLRNGVATLGDLRSCPDEVLRRMRNLGVRSVRQIRAAEAVFHAAGGSAPRGWLLSEAEERLLRAAIPFPAAVSLGTLPLNPVAVRLLSRDGLFSLEDLLRMDSSELVAIPGLGASIAGGLVRAVLALSESTSSRERAA